MPDRDEFYVGYGSTPSGHAKLLRVLVPVMMWVLAIVAGVVSYKSPAWGEGQWDTSAELAWTGVVSMDPYPVLLGDDGAMLPVVELGKIGAQERLTPLAGQRVTLRGFPLQRAGGRMIELSPGDASIETLGDAEADNPEVEPYGSVTLQGEIIDSKCFLGAMKPGEGVGHRSCAALCIRGGIPPMLMTRSESGEISLYLLVNEDGSAANERLWPLAGAPVEVAGELQRWGGALRLAVSDARGL